MPKPNHEHDHQIIGAIHDLRHEIRDLKELIMTYAEALKAFITQQTAFNTDISNGIDAAGTSLEGLTADVKNLNDQIAALQNSSGTVTAEDQAILDAAQAAGVALQEKLVAFNAAIEALNQLTPPVVPPGV